MNSGERQNNSIDKGVKRGLECLKSLSFTESKLGILELLDEPKSLTEISRSLGITKQTLSPHLRALLDLGLMEKREENYVITELGRNAHYKFKKTSKFFDVIACLKGFLKQHDLSPIPDGLLNSLDMLHGARVVVKDSPYELHPKWLEILKDSSWVYGLSSIHNKDFPGLFNSLSTSRDVKIILAQDVFEKVKESHEKELEDFLWRGEMFVCDKVKLTFIVSEKGFTMNLYHNSYDSSNILICETNDAINWGLDLFRYYLERSTRVEL